MATARSTAPTYVERNPRILHGEPIIAGTRVPVRAIVVSWQTDPNLARMWAAYPAVPSDAVMAALAYYADHCAEIDQYIAENDADFGGCPCRRSTSTSA
jgi:uncharacterized protein (DUF433 family)